MKAMEVEARRRLLRRRVALLEAIHGAKLEGPFPEDAKCPHEGYLDEARKQGRVSERELRELTEIDAALARMAEGAYGRCAECGKPIGRLRLLAVPEARVCLSCESAPAVAPVRPR